MANTFELISSVTVGSGGAASIDFTSIPSTYTDLCLKWSLRSSRSADVGDEIFVKFNGNGSSYSSRYLLGYGNSTGSGTGGSTQINRTWADSNNATSSTFANGEIYIPNYAGSNYKSASIDSVTENNATSVYTSLTAGLWSNTAAITQITLTPEVGPNWLQYSTAYLYGISKN